jgi:hypothetical protein
VKRIVDCAFYTSSFISYSLGTCFWYLGQSYHAVVGGELGGELGVIGGGGHYFSLDRHWPGARSSSLLG